MKVTDALNRILELPGSPQRIISLVPSLTELLHDLGLEKRIVGITKYCVHPYHYQSVKEKVGGTKKVKYHSIKELQPDFILCSKEENTPEMVAELEKTAPVYVSDVKTLEEALQLILKLGIIMNKRTESNQMVDKIKMRLAEFQSYLKGKRPLKTAYFIWKDPWMVVGEDTFINDILKLNRMENVFTGKGRYPEVNIQHLQLQGNPELLLFSSEPYSFKEEDVYEVLRKNEKILSVFVNGQYFSWYGSRLLRAFDHFKEIQEKIRPYES